MTMHLAAYETSASQASLTALTPVPEQVLTVSGNEIRIPKGMNNIVWTAAMINSATATLRAQLQSPSLRAMFFFDVSPIVNGLVFGSLPRILPLINSPLILQELEGLLFTAQNGAAVMNRGLVQLADGPIKPVTGKIFSVRFTTAITLVTASWVNGALTLASTLPFGTYQVVGMRVWSANLVAARLVFPGFSYRPGVPALNAEDNNEWPLFRYGNCGVFGEFQSLTPPTLDALGVTDTAQTGFLDLIKTG